MDYKSQITGFGPLALDFLGEDMIIVFNDNAPSELAELSVLHRESPVDRDIRAGDVVIFGDYSYVVTAVGEEANRTFRTMGHCTFKFTGKEQTELPGHIELSGQELPVMKIGDLLEIIFT
ncbi:MAG TPA: PTS glucitol/sorbitol transporter subunit IIA [Anaerovoracaceae bacterium]|nr:PTS glucitol/sorbitol transporter subunit IIA [Anaerovoracaceae bacterium]